MLPSLWVVPATPSMSPDAMPLQDAPPKIVDAFVGLDCLPPTVSRRDGHVPVRLVITRVRRSSIAVGDAAVMEVARTLPSVCLIPEPPTMSPVARWSRQVFRPKVVEAFVLTTVRSR